MSKFEKTKINAWIKKISSKIARALYPEGYTCFVCGKELDDKHREYTLCDKCLARLPYRHELTCPICGKYVFEVGPCVNCRDTTLPYLKAYAPFDYTGPIRYMIVSYKDKGSPWLAPYLSKFLIDYAKAMELTADYLVYVPSSESAIQTRGFEHNKKIAVAVANALGLPITEPINRIMQTKDSHKLTSDERFKNVAQSFKIKEDYDKSLLIGKRVLIIDDVMSTGATVTTCAQILKHNGAKEIIILTLARS